MLPELSDLPLLSRHNDESHKSLQPSEKSPIWMDIAQRRYQLKEIHSVCVKYERKRCVEVVCGTFLVMRSFFAISSFNFSTFYMIDFLGKLVNKLLLDVLLIKLV